MTLSTIRPSAPIRNRYEARVHALLDEMARSLISQIKAQWRKDEPETVLLGADKSASEALRELMERLGKHWQVRFDDLADSMADYFATAVNRRCDLTLASQLRKAGMSVRFRMTPAMRDAFNAVRAENVSLIRSIGSQHLSKVETLVMQSVSQGRDLGTLTKELQRQTGVSKRRASFIARDQNNKSTATMRSVREREVGITEGVWMHSGGGKEPRPEHKSFSGKRFKLADGHDFGDGFGPVLPGQAINCLPGETLIDLVNGCHEIWRYHYRGDMITLEAGEAVVRATPNHPFLTNEGWVAAQAINCGDYIWQARLKEIESGVGDIDQTQVTIEQAFLALRDAKGVSSHPAVGFDFHGDIPDADVESVRPDPDLIIHGDASLAQRIAKFTFPLANVGLVERTPPVGQVLHSGLSGSGRKGLPFTSFKPLDPETHSFGWASAGEPSALQAMAYEAARHAKLTGDGERRMPLMEHLSDGICADLGEIGNGVDASAHHNPPNHLRSHSELPSNLRNGHPLAVHANNVVKGQVDAPWAGLPFTVRGSDAPCAESLAQLVRVHAKMGSKFFEAGKFCFDRVRVSKKLVRKNARCHVYTLETNTGWYSAGQSSLATKNCRCTWRPVIPGFE